MKFPTEICLAFSAGLPAYTEYGSRFFIATDPTVNMEWSLQVTPGQAIGFTDIHVPSSILIFFIERSKPDF